jgi:hypothetical protein
MSGESAEQRLPTRQWSTAKVNSDQQCRVESEQQSQRSPDMSGVPPDCPVQQKDKGFQRSTTPNLNGRADVAHTGQRTVIVWCATGLSGVPIDTKGSQRLGSGWRL